MAVDASQILNLLQETNRRLENVEAATNKLAVTVMAVSTKISYLPTPDNCPLAPRLTDLEEEQRKATRRLDQLSSIWVLVLGGGILVDLALQLARAFRIIV